MLALPVPLSVLTALVYVAMLLGLGLIVFVPFFPGVALIAGVLAAYVAYLSFLAHGLAGITLFGAGFAVLFALMGIFSSVWTEKLGIRYTHVSQQVMWGAIIGSLVVGMVMQGLLGLMLGMIVGAIAMEVREGRRLPEALQQGVAAVYTMLGPRGFQLVMAMLIITVAAPRPIRPDFETRLQPPMDDQLRQVPATDLMPPGDLNPSGGPSSITPPEEMPPDEPPARHGDQPGNAVIGGDKPGVNPPAKAGPGGPGASLRPVGGSTP